MNIRILSTIIFVLHFTIGLYAQKYQNIWDMYFNGDFQPAIDKSFEQIKLEPDNAELNLLIGRAYTDTRQFETAIPFLQKALENDKIMWVKAWAHGYLGVCYFFVDNYVKARENLKTCISLKATDNAIKFAEKRLLAFQLTDFYKSWKIIETQNIRFHFQNVKMINDLLSFINTRQIAYNAIDKFFNVNLSKKVDFYVWENPEQAEKKLGMPLGFANPSFCIINSRKDQTVGHELTHVIAGQAIPPVHKTGLINEGIAVFFDGSGRDRLWVAKKFLNGKTVDIKDIWENPSNYPNDYFYDIGGAFIYFLSKKSTVAQMKELLEDQRYESAKTIFKDLDNWIIEFEHELNK